MDHIDPDDLALVAIGDRPATDVELRHLATCADCARDVQELTEVSAIGRDSALASELGQPHPRVWDAIALEIGNEAPVVVRLPQRRRWREPAVAAVVVGVLVIGGAIVWNAVRSSPVRQIATATLAPLPAWNGASGSATITTLSDGDRQVEISLSGEKADGNFHEAWLMTSDLKHLVSVGVISGSHGTFAVPANIDLRRFDVVDVSSEPHDGDPHHSGNSIVRGTLS